MVSTDGKIPLPHENATRFVSFNINGYKTLTHYHPWNELGSISSILNFMHADVLSFQELKLQKLDVNRNIAVIPDFNSFITVPKTKRGYSGTSLFIKSSLNVVKVEEGITGYLDVSSDPGITYRKIWEKLGNDSLAIGGYTNNIVDWKEGIDLDSDGRAIIAELENSVIIIAVYCPANSMATEIEESKRCLFLTTLFQRAENLEKLGKHVIIMGDINVAPSLIDRDDAINENIKSGLVKITSNFENDNIGPVLTFRNETKSRQILHDYLYDDLNLQPEKNKGKILHDLTRQKNLYRLKMYTCWNTLLNNRPMNIGSRIDLFLATQSISENLITSDIWPFLYGSDHCPIFCDIDMTNFPITTHVKRIKHFEAVSYYRLGMTKSIDTFFRSSRTKSTTPPSSSPAPSQSQSSKRTLTTPVYSSRKKLIGQSTLFKIVKEKEKQVEERATSSLFVDSDDDDKSLQPQEENVEKDGEKAIKKPISAVLFKDLLSVGNYGTTPRCDHKQPCVLRVTKRGPNSGRKFWCCGMKGVNNDTWSTEDQQPTAVLDPDNDQRCRFFKWAQKLN